MLMLWLTTAPDADIEQRDRAIERYIAQLAGGNTDSLAALYEETATDIYSFALSILKNTHDAEDVLHDCYLSICAAADGYRAKGKPMAWILTITRNLSFKKLASHGKAAELPQEAWENMLSANDRMDHDDRLVLAQCMTKLSDEERQIIVLHAVSGFKHREIASLLRSPLPTVLSKYSRAMKKLKKFLTEGEQI